MTDDEAKVANTRVKENAEKIETFVMKDRPWAALIIVQRMWELLAVVNIHMAHCHTDDAVELEAWLMTLMELVSDVARTEPTRVYEAEARAKQLKQAMTEMAMPVLEDVKALRQYEMTKQAGASLDGFLNAVASAITGARRKGGGNETPPTVH